MTELMLVAPQVVAMRCWQLALGAGTSTPQSRRESQRMVQEKVDATGDAAQAALLEWSRVQTRWSGMYLQAWLHPWQWPARSVEMTFAGWRDGEGIAAKALQPVRKRVVANAKRLRREQRR